MLLKILYEVRLYNSVNFDKPFEIVLLVLEDEEIGLTSSE